MLVDGFIHLCFWISVGSVCHFSA